MLTEAYFGEDRIDHRRIERIWQIGYGSKPAKVKPKELPEITDDLKEVLEDADNGWWKFVRTVGSQKKTVGSG